MAPHRLRFRSPPPYHVRGTAIVAALVADDAPLAETENRLERARERLGAHDLWMLDSAGRVLARAGRSSAPPIAESNGVQLARVGGEEILRPGVREGAPDEKITAVAGH